MRTFLRRFFENRYFPERILFLSIAGGMLLDGYISAAFVDMTAEAALRVTVSLLSLSFIPLTFRKGVQPIVIRSLAIGSIVILLLFSVYLNTRHHLDFDNALTFLGIFIICSLYFRSVRSLVFYLLFGLSMAALMILFIDHPQVDAPIFLLRLFLGSLLILALSLAMRQFQVKLERITRRVAEENRALNETKSALEERLTHEHLLALVASRANSAVIITNREDRIEWVNQFFLDMTGYSKEEIYGMSPSVLRGKKTDPEAEKRIEEKKKLAQPFHDIILNYKKDGTPFWVHLHVTPLFDEEGNVERYIAIQEDITEQKKIEDDLRKNREQLKEAQQQAKIGSWEWYDGSDIVSCSDEMCRIFGLPVHEHYPLKQVFDLIFPADLAMVRKSIEIGLKKISPFEIGFRVSTTEGLKHLYLTGRAVSDGKKRTLRLFGSVQDITERKNIENEMQLAEKQYRSLFENSQHMICMHSPDGTILSINPAGAHALGFEPEELIARNIRSFFQPGKEKEFEEYIRAIVSSGQSKGVLRLRKRDGSSSVWLYSNILLQGNDGMPFVLSSTVEITERYAMEKELRRAKILAEEALVMKDRFVANISHELRTPLNAIIGFSDLLMNTELAPEQYEYLDAVHIAADNLAAMINDVLDLAKIEAGKIEFEQKPYSIRDVLSNTHRLLSQRAKNQKLDFKWECDARVPVYVLGDELRLSQVLINLVANAVKFTEKGFVHFSCSVITEEDGYYMLRFDVEDSGVGIPADQLTSIFEPFNQASLESTRKFGGTGLGLSIVRDLVELQGGTVLAKSAPGIGSKFTVELPVKKVSVDVVQQVDYALKPIELPANVKILIVEDQPLNQQLAKRLITDFGFTPEVAFNGRMAIDFLKNNKYDLVLMDLSMPEMDGYDATRVIREKLRLDVPVIALTAHSSAGEKEKCIAAGMNDYLSKPFRGKELYLKIVGAMKKNISEKETALLDSEAETPLKSLAGGDRNFEREMIEIMLRSIPEDFALMKDALQKREFE
ncbi:MAG TPA: PAS domain S-box protein, partial [Bacteroidia bacterium]|nr:PAS domain S-box protein [Bacteroidia bacterium]